MSRCPYCSWPLELVRVHGHDQCRRCRVNVHPCCNGEQCEAWSVPMEPEVGKDQPTGTESRGRA